MSFTLPGFDDDDDNEDKVSENEVQCNLKANKR